MLKLVVIGAGGALGAILRYVVSGLSYRIFRGGFPVGTLAVNLSGSFLIGLVWGMFEHVPVSASLRWFIFIGVLGGYTTFSTFALENLNLIRDGEFNTALLNVLISNAGGILLAYAGWVTARFCRG